MAKEQVIYLKTTGLNLTKTAENLDWSQEGTTELAECVNCIVDSYGKLERGFGSTVLAVGTIPGVQHTLISAGGRNFLGLGAVLYELVGEALVVRKNDCSGNPVAISVYGGIAYCCDGVSLFKVSQDGTATPWAFTEKVGAKSTRPFASPILHSKSTNGFGRVFILSSGIVFYSDPIGVNLFDYSTNVIWDANPIQDFVCSKGLMVIGTAKTTFALIGTDFTKVEKLWLTGLPVIQNTLCSGFLDGEEVICFTVADGMYAVSAGGKTAKLTEDKVGKKFFNKSFIGASILDGRYTVYGAEGVESYAVDLVSKSLEVHTLQYSKVSGSLAIKGDYLVELGIGDGSFEEESTVTFPSLAFGTSLLKSFRYIQVSGFFASTVTWTISDEFGRESVIVMQPTGTSGSRLVKLPVSCLVKGQYLSVSFVTDAYFKLDSLHAVPILHATRG